jgi:hypothetical protein
MRQGSEEVNNERPDARPKGNTQDTQEKIQGTRGERNRPKEMSKMQEANTTVK